MSGKKISARIDSRMPKTDDLPGQALLDVVFARLNLIETAYFGIRYIDQDNQTHWLDPASRLSRQLKGNKVPYDLYFGVKFYACDPCKLVEEITRYQLYLQVKQDILQGRLPVSFELAAELGAYVVQAELGDYDPRKHPLGYVSEFRLLNNQTKEIENRIHELHMQLKGMAPSQAEFNYLDKVKWHDMYGVDLHPVLGEDSVEYYLGLTPGGIVVLRNKTTVAHYYWPRIAKVYFKGRYFMLRVCDKNNEISTYGFETPKKTACKHLWKCCVEHHSFFRLVRTAPMQATAGAASLTSLSSKFSGRTERQQVKDVMSLQRAPPAFTRTPSRRQPRRIVDEHPPEEKIFDAPKYIQQEIKSVSIPQPAQTFDSPYRSTCSIPAALNTSSKAHPPPPDSPRSTRSAPWMRSQQRGLFGINSSPKSVRSASTRMSAPANPNRMRSSSVESHSSNESRSGRRRRHRSRRVSDNESEMSRGSGRSGRSHNSHRKHRRHRSKNRRNRSDTESRDRSYSSHHRSTESIELVDSGEQWLEVQRKQADNVQKAAVIKSSQVLKGSTPDSGIVAHHHRSRRHRKHRSPSEKIWSSELTKHLQFDLVDTTGMSEDQLREIPYTVVETSHHHASKKPSALKVHKTSHNVPPIQRIDRIREFSKENVVDNMSGVNGSIRSASTISSSRDYDRNSGLIRMMSSMSMGDFISPTGSSLSPLDSTGLRVSHEHTDSGLGADQDYAYSSERSSDSAKYGTNKSSGASVTSAHTKSSSSNNMKSHHHSVSSSNTTNPQTTRKPPLCPQSSGRVGQVGKPPQGVIPGVHSSSSSGPNNRLINQTNTHFQNNHYTFSLTRNYTNSGHHQGGRGSSAAFGSSTGYGLNSYGYLDSVATLSSASPYHYYYDGSGFRSTANQPPPVAGSGGLDSSRLGSIRGTKSDIGVPIRPKRHHHHHQQQPHPQQQYITNVHNFNRLGGGGGSKRTLGPITKTDYLENYKTGVERLKQTNKINNNNSPPKDFPGLLSSSTSVQNIVNNNYQPPLPNLGSPSGEGKAKVGPLVYLDQNRNGSPLDEGGRNLYQSVSSQSPASVVSESGRTSKVASGEDQRSGRRPSPAGALPSPSSRLPRRGGSGLDISRKNSLNAKLDEVNQGGAANRSSSLELILSPIIQSRRAQ